jgi:chemotaxis protein MotB
MSDERPIIIIKKKGGHEAHHGGSWKVAYADFVTAMMAFFLVMWILGLNQETRQSIAAYFNNPAGFVKSGKGGKNPMSLAAASASGKPAITPGRASIVKENEGAKFKEVKDAIENLLNSSPDLKGLKGHVEITITQEGLRIELIEDDKRPIFFDSGSAALRPDTAKLLGKIGPMLAQLTNSLTVEGHTDAQPYSGGARGYSNWNLSSDRAISARNALAAALRPGQISRVAGYADSRPRNPVDPFHFSNRRVSFLLEYSQTAQAAASEAHAPGQFAINIRPPRPNFAPPPSSELEHSSDH